MQALKNRPLSFPIALYTDSVECLGFHASFE